MRRKLLNQLRLRRAKKVRARIRGTAAKPRLSVFRSHRYIYAQFIDDDAEKTILSFSSNSSKNPKIKSNKKKLTKTEVAKEVGKELAEKAKKLGIKSVIFDRGRYKYHGRIKILAEAAREAGLTF